MPTIVALPTMTRTAAFWTTAGLLLLVLAASGVPTPLYRVYQEQFGFGAGTLTTVFGIYALALLAALLVVGGLSDHVGRRPVLIGGLLLQAVSMTVFLAADGVGWLLAARVLQGLSMGALTGTLGALLLDTQRAGRPLGALVNSAAPGFGLSLGAVGAGLVVEYVAEPTPWVFAVLTVVLLLAAGAAVLLPETSPRAPGALRSLRPAVRVPRSQRSAFLTALPAIVAAWALGGLYLSLGPSLVATVFGIEDHLVGSLLVLAMQGMAAIGAVLGRDLVPVRAMVTGASVFAAGVTGTIAALLTGSVAVLFGSAVVSGLGFGLAFLGAVATASAGVAPGERAGLLSSVFVAGYLSFSVPAVIAGVAAGTVGLETVAEVYAAVLVVLALGAVAGVRLRRRAARRPEPAPEAARSSLAA
ncbi:MFS transporter [Blastococcus xanthinilyticus]|uniref:Putative MFS family arabinose efflux permease n=1 Tax=Blastococcus xanthinilyticus TaxID=1564164 RepID=A0A5S5CP28_9ACTN|nr:MFS transporter [Blastococcus xanthinilyticus]TYP80607.1 putative MFS family arabinose efflux permease [Blastococcus xanthinilyticus]